MKRIKYITYRNKFGNQLKYTLEIKRKNKKDVGFLTCPRPVFDDNLEQHIFEHNSIVEGPMLGFIEKYFFDDHRYEIWITGFKWKVELFEIILGILPDRIINKINNNTVKVTTKSNWNIYCDFYYDAINYLKKHEYYPLSDLEEFKKLYPNSNAYYFIDLVYHESDNPPKFSLQVPFIDMTVDDPYEIKRLIKYYLTHCNKVKNFLNKELKNNIFNLKNLEVYKKIHPFIKDNIYIASNKVIKNNFSNFIDNKELSTFNLLFCNNENRLEIKNISNSPRTIKIRDLLQNLVDILYNKNKLDVYKEIPELENFITAQGKVDS